MKPDASNRSPAGGWQRTLKDVLMQHNRMVHDGSKRAGESTQSERREILYRAFRQLHALGYAVQDVRSFRRKHAQALIDHWVGRGYKPATLQKYISALRVFADWIGKPGMIGESQTLVPDPALVTRVQAAQTDKSWTSRNVDVRDKLVAVSRHDALVALQLELQLAFGLRMKEACLLRPHLADNHTFLAVNWGTKGGRQRIVPIDTEYKRALLERAKRVVKRKQDSLVPAHMNWIAWRNHFYYVCRKENITRAEGITSHGLRHEYVNDLFQMKTGERSAVRGGEQSRIDPEELELAQRVVAEHAGHSRPQISTAYTGSFRKPRRKKIDADTSERALQLNLPL